MSNDKYDLNIEEGSGFVIKKDHIYLVGKMIGLPEDFGLPLDHPDMKQKQALFYGERESIITKNKDEPFSFRLDADSCKQLAEFLMKVWEESQ